jgi:hypothetical protein
MTDDAGGLLYAGEARIDEAYVDDARLVLTSHRLLVQREHGQRLRTVERPNVLGVATETQGHVGRLSLGMQSLVLGVVLVAFSRFARFDGLVPTIENPGTAGGLGGLFEAAAFLFEVLQVLDDALLVGGLLAIVAGAGLVAWWVLTRETVVAVQVSGGEPIHLPSSAPGRDAERVRALLEA